MNDDVLSMQGAFDDLCCYTLGLGDSAFRHQHVVDAFAAQYAERHTKPITVAFALVGLYLHIRMGFSGRQVQLVHMAIAKRKRAWPAFALPAERGALTCADVLAVPAGPRRHDAIDAWCLSVWEAYAASHGAVEELLLGYGYAPSRGASRAVAEPSR